MVGKKTPDVTSPGVSKGTRAPAKATSSRKGAKTQSLRSPRVSKGNVISTTPDEFAPTLGELDLHLFGEGKHERIYEKLGAHLIMHEGERGVAFAVWAPNAKSIAVVGNFNEWNGAKHQMRLLGSSGVWELFVPGLGAGELYKYEIKHGRSKFLKADPYAFMMQVPPDTSSITFKSSYKFQDRAWTTRRKKRRAWREPLSIYEVHLGSWRRITEEKNRPLTYREIAPLLADSAVENGFTHVEFMPLREHPYGPSWGYQVSAYYAASARYGTPDDLRFLIDHLHQRGVGVIMDWVPAHFPKDAFALARFDGTALYEHLDPRRGEHPDWGTYIFNYGRNEVRNFLIGNALFWLREFHLDGLRVDAVASMLYLDYSRSEGQWTPNQFGGRENIEAVSFLQEVNATCYRRAPGVMMIAEESTAWPGVTRPVHLGGLGFGFKWNLGWMHDTLTYMSLDPVYRQYHHNEITFSLMYAFSENFVLSLSHDEVVHGKRSLLGKMPGDEWNRFAGLRALLAYMWAHPGKQLLFMGSEFGQGTEWSAERGLDWWMLDYEYHSGTRRLVRDLNRAYRGSPALWALDNSPAGFSWIDANDAAGNVLSFLRLAGNRADPVGPG